MIKQHAPSGLKPHESPVTVIPVLRSGLIGCNDMRGLLRKTGSEWLSTVTATPGRRLLHVVALGCTEIYGPNRNGDGFRKKACREYHPTFVKSAKWYRNHKTTGPHFGEVLQSCFNEDLGRVELLVSLYATKQAADEAGGEIDDIAMQRLDSNKDVPVSMGCAVPYDVCSYCGNKAKNKNYYCTDRNCEAGGLSKKMGHVVRLPNGDLHQLHADNQHLSWIDISHITTSRQADRIAFVQREIC